jgi:hypothetical protein
MALDRSEHWVSPTIKKSDLAFPLSRSEKIRVFEDRVIGWQLSIALSCYHKVPHGGFGALYIALSYFELIARYREGSVDDQAAGRRFRTGFSDFARHIGITADPDYSIIESLLYKGARNGLYHIGMTSKRVFIEGKLPKMFNYDHPQQRLVIDPEKLITAIIGHFRAYTAALRSGSNPQLVSNFLTKFDHDILPQLV